MNRTVLNSSDCSSELGDEEALKDISSGSIVDESFEKG